MIPLMLLHILFPAFTVSVAISNRMSSILAEVIKIRLK